jgi:hypothetical protein
MIYMKKLFAIILLTLVLMLGACRSESSIGEATSATETTSAGTETSSGTASSSSATAVPVDVNANDEAFVQTGEQYEEITITIDGATPSTIVVEKGDLVTLVVYSERLKPTQIYNEDLLVDQNVDRGETVELTIEANEEGIFYFTDKNTGDELFKFMIAGQSFGQNN